MSSETTGNAGFYEFLAWLDLNKKRIATVLGAAIAVGFVVYVYRYFREEKETKASSALIALRPPLSGGTNVPPPAPSSFLAIANDYSGTAAAERAHLLAAAALFDDNKYADAQKEFEGFV